MACTVFLVTGLMTGPLQTTSSEFPTCRALRPTQPPTHNRKGSSSS